MEEASGKGQKASTHDGKVGVDIAASENQPFLFDTDAITVLFDSDATSTLPNKGNKACQEKVSTPLGRWGGFMMVSAYIGCVVMDVATVQCDFAVADVDATSGALPNAKKARQ